MEKQPRVVIGIVNFNSTEDTIRLLDSLKELDYPKQKLKLIVVENASSDITPQQFITKIRPYKKLWDIAVVQETENIGLSKALNNIVKMCPKDFKYIWRLDNDTQVDPQALQIMVKELEKDNHVGMVASTAYEYDNRKQLVGGPRSFSWFTGINLLRKSKKAVDCQYMPGYSALIPLAVAREVGYISDERYFAYLEDIDFSYVLTKLGYTVRFQPKSVVYHRDDPVKAFRPRIMYLLSRNLIFFMNKHAAWWQRTVCFIYLLTLNNALILYITLKTGKSNQLVDIFKYYWKGLRDGFLNRLGTPAW